MARRLIKDVKMWMFKKSKNLKAFTLIELLVVISIIGLLSTFAIIALNNAKAKARDTKRMNDLKTISQALEMYYLDNGTYPISCAEAEVPNPCSPEKECGSKDIIAFKNHVCSGYAFVSSSGQTYLNLIPVPPNIKTEFFWYYMESRKCSAPCISILLEEQSVKKPVLEEQSVKKPIYSTSPTLFWCQKGSCAKAQKVADSCPSCLF
jgi:prepilin-type N-terminal cleavage/methylation domain-containing protein